VKIANVANVVSAVGMLNITNIIAIVRITGDRQRKPKLASAPNLARDTNLAAVGLNKVLGNG
jgi:hypothetical protein